MNGGMTYVPGGYYGDDLPMRADGCTDTCCAPVGGDHDAECDVVPLPTGTAEPSWTEGELREAYGK